MCMDLAVGVIIGASFTGIVNSLVKDVIMPPVGLALGGVDFSNFFVVLKGDRAVDTLAAAKAAKDVTLNYGLFVNAIINFLIVAFVLFLLIRQMNKLVAPTPAAEAAAAAVRRGAAAARDPRRSESAMRVSRAHAGGLASLAVLLAAAPLAAQTDMTGVANGFLGVYGSFHPSDGIPDADGRARLAPYLSPRLNKLLADGAAAEARFAAKMQGCAALDRRRSFLVPVRRRHRLEAGRLRHQRRRRALSASPSPMPKPAISL